MEWMPTSTEPHESHPATSLPAIVSTSDLFEGDLFGDELIDIYHTVAGSHGK
jgi:hypothetical protein